MRRIFDGQGKNGIENEDLLQLYFDALMYVRIAEFYDDRYVTFVEKSDNDVRIKLFVSTLPIF